MDKWFECIRRACIEMYGRDEIQANNQYLVQELEVDNLDLVDLLEEAHELGTSLEIPSTSNSHYHRPI